MLRICGGCMLQRYLYNNSRAMHFCKLYFYIIFSLFEEKLFNFLLAEIEYRKGR